jgi:AcrR family transcriptional regulator
LANAADISEAVLYRHFSTKQKLFEEVVERNVERRLATVEKRFSSIPNLPPLECVERLGEDTIMACAGLDGNASVMAWALMEMPHFAKEVYRREIGATEAMWDNELARRFPESPLRARLAIHLAPYAVHACMAFGLWLAALRHQPATAAAHANQYAEGIANAARVILETPAGPPEMSGCTDLIETAGLFR